MPDKQTARGISSRCPTRTSNFTSCVQAPTRHGMCHLPTPLEIHEHLGCKMALEIGTRGHIFLMDQLAKHLIGPDTQKKRSSRLQPHDRECDEYDTVMKQFN